MRNVTAAVLSLLIISTTAAPLIAADNKSLKIKDKAAILTSGSPPWAKQIKYLRPHRVGKDKTLLAVGSTLFMLNDDRQPQWKFDVKSDINSFAYVPNAESIYVMAMDLTWVALDARTGKKKWEKGSNGRATYGEVQPFGEDKYIVLTDMSGYDGDFMACEEEREKNKKVKCARTLPDLVEVYKDQEPVGEASFPSDAHLAVVGDGIWAISTGKKTVTITEIKLKKQS